MTESACPIPIVGPDEKSEEMSVEFFDCNFHFVGWIEDCSELNPWEDIGDLGQSLC